MRASFGRRGGIAEVRLFSRKRNARAEFFRLWPIAPVRSPAPSRQQLGVDQTHHGHRRNDVNDPKPTSTAYPHASSRPVLYPSTQGSAQSLPCSGSGPNRFGPTVPRMQNQTMRMIHPITGMRPSRIHQPVWSRSCNRRMPTARLGRNVANDAIAFTGETAEVAMVSPKIA